MYTVTRGAAQCPGVNHVHVSGKCQSGHPEGPGLHSCNCANHAHATGSHSYAHDHGRDGNERHPGQRKPRRRIPCVCKRLTSQRRGCCCKSHRYWRRRRRTRPRRRARSNPKRQVSNLSRSVGLGVTAHRGVLVFHWGGGPLAGPPGAGQP